MSIQVRALLLLTALVLTALSGCNAQPGGVTATTAPTAQVSTPSVEVTAAYPAPDATSAVGPTYTPYPGPSDETPIPTRTPQDTQNTPRRGLANIQGTILALTPGTSEAAPLENTTLYLAAMLDNMEGKPSGIVRVNESNAPLAITNLEGEFVFVNIEPGWYGLVIKHPLSLLMATNTTTGDDIVFELKEGDKLDLGKFTVSLSGG